MGPGLRQETCERLLKLSLAEKSRKGEVNAVWREGVQRVSSTITEGELDDSTWMPISSLKTPENLHRTSFHFHQNLTHPPLPRNLAQPTCSSHNYHLASTSLILAILRPMSFLPLSLKLTETPWLASGLCRTSSSL